MADLVSQHLRDNLLVVFDDPNYRPPPLPSVALDLMLLVSREDTKVTQVVSLLERDEMLAATTLRLVSSPVYAGSKPIHSLHDAVVRLGMRVVRDAVIEAALRRGVFAGKGYAQTLALIARHSTLTAYITRSVGRRSAFDLDLAFIAGLIHDVGFAGLLLAVADVEGSNAPPLHTFWKELDSIHESASAVLVQRWGFPPALAEVVAHHHHIQTGPFAKVAAAVRLADHLTEYFGTGISGPEVDGQPLPGDSVGTFDVETACAELGLDGAVLRHIIADAERMIPEIALA